MNIVDKIASQAGLARFVSLTYSSKTTGEVARYVVQLGFSYRNLLHKSLIQLEVEREIMTDLSREAADDLIESMNESLNGTQNKYTKKDIYQDYVDPSGKKIQGVKVNKNDGSIKIFGLITSKTQITPPVNQQKPKESSPLVAAKDRIRKSLPIGRFREFSIDNLHSAKINGEVLEIE